MNPELRHTLNTLSHNFENANQAAQENIYTFTQLYVDPCLAGFKSCIQDCTAPCLTGRDDGSRRRRGRGRSRGQAEHFFDFYDDWDDDENMGNTGGSAWGNDELDSLLAGHGQQPKRPRAMSYGSKSRRRPGPIHPSDNEDDPTMIPGSSYLGFLERLPFKIGARVLKYKPSAANLQEHPGAKRSLEESQPLLEDDGYGTLNEPPKKGHTRQRSSTQNSRATTNSLSSRGDLILSDEEEDAVPLDDEFAVALSRRITNTESQSSGKASTTGNRRLSRRSTQRTVSSKSSRSHNSNQSTPSNRSKAKKTRDFTSPDPTSPAIEDIEPFPSMRELRQEEDDARRQEELEIEQKREVAARLAVQRGLSTPQHQPKEGESQGVALAPNPAYAEDGLLEHGETRSMTEIGDSTDYNDADDDALAASRDTLSSDPPRAQSESSLLEMPTASTEQRNTERPHPP
jgi:hypothetical protein